jgi:predicted nucleotidyltransferase
VKNSGLAHAREGTESKMKTNQRNRRSSRKTKKSLRVPRKFAALRDAIVPILEPYGVKRIALFGSMARGEETPKSDIDILVDFEEPRRRPLGLFEWGKLEDELRKRLGRKVDLISATALNKYIRPYVEKEMVILYDAKR